MDPGAYFETVIITILMALTFIALLLAFLYLIYGREKTTA